MNEDERTVFVNPSMAVTRGYDPLEMQGHPVAASQIEKVYQEIAVQYEHGFIRKDGSALQALVSVSPMVGEELRRAIRLLLSFICAGGSRCPP